MPQGKGTYGSQVGRPPKKKKYQAGGAVNIPKPSPNFPQENPAIAEANKMGQEMESISLENIPMTNAMGRKQTSPIGAEVGTGVYKKGGKVTEDIRDIVRATSEIPQNL